MTTAIHSDTPSANRRNTRSVAIAFVTVILLLAASYTAGYMASTKRHADRVYEEGQRQMLEALVICIKSGLISVNENQMVEPIIE